MDKTFIEQQQQLALQHLTDLGERKREEKEATLVITEYLSSLLHPTNYTEVQREDLRKLALEFGYREGTHFGSWVFPVSNTEKQN